MNINTTAKNPSEPDYSSKNDPKIVSEGTKTLCSTQDPFSIKAKEAPAEANGEKQIYCLKNQLDILGTAQTMGAAPWEDVDHEIWGVAQCAVFPAFQRADILFELHTRDYWADPNVLERLNKWTGRLVMHDHYDEVPRSEKFPIETILQYRRYHRTTITYMLALAYHSFKLTGKPWHVGLFGIHMEDVQEEYGEQRPCCEYWLGRMEDAGMDIFISGGAVLAAPFLYGYERYNALVWKLRQRHDGLLNGVQAKQEEHREKGNEVHRQIGAANECDYWLRLAQRGELSADTLEKAMNKEKEAK
jgi:hypothetical protein